MTYRLSTIELNQDSDLPFNLLTKREGTGLANSSVLVHSAKEKPHNSLHFISWGLAGVRFCDPDEQQSPHRTHGLTHGTIAQSAPPGAASVGSASRPPLEISL